MALVPCPTVLSTDEMGRVAAPIFTSVGQDAVNAPGDVFIIQSLLNDRLPKPHSPVVVTGRIDPGTILALQAYQAVVMGMNSPTGHVQRPIIVRQAQAAQHGTHGADGRLAAGLHVLRSAGRVCQGTGHPPQLYTCEPPIVAAITVGGWLELRWPRLGLRHDLESATGVKK